MQTQEQKEAYLNLVIDELRDGMLQLMATRDSEDSVLRRAAKNVYLSALNSQIDFEAAYYTDF